MSCFNLFFLLDPEGLKVDGIYFAAAPIRVLLVIQLCCSCYTLHNVYIIQCTCNICSTRNSGPYAR